MTLMDTSREKYLAEIQEQRALLAHKERVLYKLPDLEAFPLGTLMLIHESNSTAPVGVWTRMAGQLGWLMYGSSAVRCPSAELAQRIISNTKISSVKIVTETQELI